MSSTVTERDLRDLCIAPGLAAASRPLALSRPAYACYLCFLDRGRPPPRSSQGARRPPERAQGGQDRGGPVAAVRSTLAVAAARATGPVVLDRLRSLSHMECPSRWCSLVI